MRRFPFLFLCLLTLTLGAGAAVAGASTPRQAVRAARAGPSRFVSKQAAKAYAARVSYLVSLKSGYDDVCDSSLDTIQGWATQEQQTQGDGTSAFAVTEQQAAEQYASWDGDSGLKATYGQYLKQFKKTYGTCAKYFRRAADRSKFKRLAGKASDDFSRLVDVQLGIGAAYYDLSVGHFESAVTDANDASGVQEEWAPVVTGDLDALKALEN